MKNKKALSQVVSIMIILLLVFAVGGIVFVFVKNFANKNLNKTSSCYNIYEKITLNNDFTCYNSTGQYVQFSISRKEIELDSLIISITFEENSKTYSLTNLSQNVSGLSSSLNGEFAVNLPGENSGKPYYATNITEQPLTIEIAPIINNHNCNKIDEILDIPICF
ncbi:MAG: hypothetical protein WC812_03000 [Candidatus Pacearchaeota archaeon]|jgi:hypothetical protein